MDRDWEEVSRRVSNAVRSLDDEISLLKGIVESQKEDLLAYEEHYGTSIAQIRHLRECDDVRCRRFADSCPDYPSE